MATGSRGSLVPGDTVLTDEEVTVCLVQLDAAKRHGFADVLFTFDAGKMVKRGWLTLKGPPVALGHEDTPPARGVASAQSSA